MHKFEKTAICFVARCGLTSGSRAVRWVHTDMKNALMDYRTQCGPDFLHLLPSLEQLSAMFRSAPRQVSVDRDGEKFAHKFLELDYRDTDGVYLLFTLGSCRKLDTDFEQPALARMVEVVRRVQPDVLFMRRDIRIGLRDTAPLVKSTRRWRP